MIIKSATRLAFAAGCLTAIVTLPTAYAQMGAPGGYGYGPPPGAYGYGPPPGAYGYGPPPGAYAPQSQYVPPPPSAGTAGTQLITNGPQANPGDVSPILVGATQCRGKRTVRQVAQGKSGIPPGAYAQGMWPDNRSATSSAVPRQLCSVLTLSRSNDRVRLYAFS